MRLTTDRLVVRLVHERDVRRVWPIITRKIVIFKTPKPVRDESHCYPRDGRRLGMIGEFHKQGSAFYFALLDPEEKKLSAWRIFQWRVLFMPVIWLFHCAEVAGARLMFEALTAAIRYMQRTQHIHRIMKELYAAQQT